MLLHFVKYMEVYLISPDLIESFYSFCLFIIIIIIIIIIYFLHSSTVAKQDKISFRNFL